MKPNLLILLLMLLVKFIIFGGKQESILMDLLSMLKHLEMKVMLVSFTNSTILLIENYMKLEIKLVDNYLIS